MMRTFQLIMMKFWTIQRNPGKIIARIAHLGGLEKIVELAPAAIEIATYGNISEPPCLNRQYGATKIAQVNPPKRFESTVKVFNQQFRQYEIQGKAKNKKKCWNEREGIIKQKNEQLFSASEG